MVISLNAETSWTKSNTLPDESLGEIRDKRATPNCNKGVYNKSNDIKLNEEKLKAIPIQEKEKGCLLSPYLFNLILGSSSLSNMKRKAREYKFEKKKSKYHYLQMI